MFTDMADPRDMIRLAVQKMDEGHKEYRRSFSSDADIFWNLDCVRECNARGRSICGQASSWLEELLPVFMEKHGLACSVFKVTSSVSKGCFHHFNMVKIEGREPVICDLTAAQYFNRPVTAMKGHAYFVGTRAELREIVTAAKQNSWDEIHKAFPERRFRSLWDVDFAYHNDRDFRLALCGYLDRKTHTSCLRTESFYYPMEITWGDKRSHLLNRHMDDGERAKLSAVFKRVDIPDLTEDRDPEIPGLITIINARSFTLRDAPVIQP